MLIRVCVADDHRLMLAAVMQALRDADGVELAGMTHRAAEVEQLVDAHVPDLLLLDHTMPALDGVDCVMRMKSRHPAMKIVILSASENPTEINEALHAGADAYIGKRIHPQDLASALRQVVTGVVYQAGFGLAANDSRPCDLTERELTLLEAISRGLSTKVISRELWISEKTVKFHLTNIYRKLGVHNRAGAMRYAFDHKLVEPAPLAEISAATA
jgi:DNA-binding NarL/FixJ family response regulator